MQKIRCSINDEIHEIGGISPVMSLLHFLRYKLALKGTKEGCNEGDCGACTVIIRDDYGPHARYRAVNSCLILMPMLQGAQIYTIEALDIDGRHPVQTSILKTYASQCGYCTPGIAMSLFEASYRHDMKEPWQFVDQMAGNLCRCTGYRPILESVHELAGTGKNDYFTRKLSAPPLAVETLDYRYDDKRFFVPVTLDEALDFKSSHPDVTIVSGSSDVSVVVNKSITTLRNYMSLNNVRELRRITVYDSGVTFFGSSARLSDIEAFCEDNYAPLGRMLRYFASHQIKHVATLGGSVSGASPVSDIAPVMAALDASVIIGSNRGKRQLKIDEFILGYRKTALEPDEFVIGFEVPPLPAHVRCGAYKISKRQELDISSVSSCHYVETDDDNIVKVARFAFGGMAAIAGARAHQAEASLIGKAWTEENVEIAALKIAEDFKPITDVRASAWYRSQVAANLIRGFYHETLENRQPKRLYRPTATLQLGE